jgi:signal transduction histidine kinase
MPTRSLKWLTIILPPIFVLLILAGRQVFYGIPIDWRVEIVTLIVVVLGAAALSLVVFRLVEAREREIRRRTVQLVALNDASLVLTQELDLPVVLQKVVDLACDLVQATYGALGVLDDDGVKIAQFLTSGMSQEQMDRIGYPPVGRGLLGALITGGEPMRISDIQADPRATGFPLHHPPMKSFLGSPIKLKDRVIGNIYLTDKTGGEDQEFDQPVAFSKEDQYILEMFATQAAIAIENAQLYRKTQQLAILQERERFGMDLHDGIIQSVYGIGLMLEDTQLRMKTDPDIVDDRIQRTIAGLNELIRDIRNYILDLRPHRFQGRNLKGGLEELARDLQANTFLNVELLTDGIDLSYLTPEQTVEILHIAQEALTNVRKHARATHVQVRLDLETLDMVLSIEDDGIGFDLKQKGLTVGNGLRNMHERAGALQGEISFKPRSPKGMRVMLRVPVGGP